jgi:SAM-dependent methyltransferase
MVTNFINFLECTSCHGDLHSQTGYLRCQQCNQSFTFEGKIARFVEDESYSASFGLQWNEFSKSQLDSHLGTNRSLLRFETETGWTEAEIRNQFVLDAGSGAGRFSEVAVEFGAKLLTVDYSSDIEVTAENLSGRGEFIAIQADLRKLPLKGRSLSYIYCIGVLQHTEYPNLVLQELARVLRINGMLVLSYYPNTHWYTKMYSKYIIRPVTKRLPKPFLLRIVVLTSQIWFPVTNLLFSMPKPFSKLFRFIIPVANYVEFEYRNAEDQRTEAILDTFDMLSPQFDHPFTQSEILEIFAEIEGEFSFNFISEKNGTVRIKRTK